MKRIEFKNYAGVRVGGKIPLDLSESTLHMEHAFWLTSQVESGGKFGCVLNYDGTGMTAGIDQCIAVYPRALDDGKRKNDQGPLWGLLASIRAAQPGLWTHRKLDIALEREGWYLSGDGKCRWAFNGRLVPGKKIREVFTGDRDGVMPEEGPGRKAATKWVRLFHRLFSDEATFPIQVAYGLRHFQKRSCKRLSYSKYGFNRAMTINDAVYESTHLSAVTDCFSDDFDLAMSVWWSHTVNAPAVTLKKLCKIIDKYGKATEENQLSIARAIMRSLANSHWGRWNDEIKNGRWQRTRKYAMKVWPKELFAKDGIMPKKIVG